MWLRAIASFGIITWAASAGLANDVTKDITGAGGTTFFGAVHTDSADFTDVFTYTVGGPVKANLSLITIGSGSNNIDFLTADLNGTPVTLSPNGFLETGSLGDTELTGPLILTVTGRSGASDGTYASYSGTMNVSVVPEPHTASLVLVSLGCLNAMTRRRRTAA